MKTKLSIINYQLSMMKSFILLAAIFFASFTATGQNVCQIGSTGYTSLGDALAAVTGGQTILLLADITYEAPVDLGSKSITFDFGTSGTSLIIDASATPGSAALTTSGDLTVTGTGRFTAKGDQIGINLTGTGGSQNLYLYLGFATIQTTGAGAGTAGILSSNSVTAITGWPTLRIEASGTSGDGIRLSASDAGINLNGTSGLGLNFTAKGSGAGHGLNFTAEGNHIVNINMNSADLTGGFSGGENGNGLNYQGTTGTLSIANNGSGYPEFSGVNGVYTKSDLTVNDYANYGSELSFWGGCGIKMDNVGKTLTANGSRAITISGGYNNSTEPGESAGLWLKGSTTIVTGNSSFSPKGNSGIYVDTDGAVLTISTSSSYIGSKWFAPATSDVSNDGYGIYAAGALTLAQSGSYRVDVKAQGGKNLEGVFIGGGKDLTLSGNLTMEADGGTSAKGMAFSGAGKVNFDNALQQLTVNNNSGSEETVSCSRTSALSSLYWTTRDDGTLATGDDDASDAVTFVVPASTETASTGSIFFSNGIPVIYTTYLPFGINNASYNTTLSATNNVTSWNITSGTLPDGLTLDNNGRISGTPTATPSYYSFTITASNTHGTSAPVTLNLLIQDFVPVSDVSLYQTPTVSLAYLPFYLYGSITPYDATYQDVVWSIESAGTTGATISDGNLLYAAAKGKAIVRATIINGKNIGEDFTKDFTISITDDVCEMVGGDMDGKKYKNLQDAMSDAMSMNTPSVIRLLDDIISSSGIYLYNNAVTFDLNGYNLTQICGEGGSIYLDNGQIDYTGAGNFKLTTMPNTYASPNLLSLNDNSSCTMTSIEINGQGQTGVSGYSGIGAFNGDIIINEDYSTGVNASGDSQITMKGNIIASGSNSVGVNTTDNSQVTIDGKIDAARYIVINGVEKTADDKEAVSSKPGYDEYTDGSSTVWVKQPASSSNFRWQGTTDSNWDTESNWAGGQVPAETDVVVIPANATYFPILQNPVSVAEIHFEQGAQIGAQHLLNGKAFVQYDFSQPDSRNRWNMLSMPLGQAYPGDFAFGGYPVTWVRTFETVKNGSLTEGTWTTAKGRTTPLSFGDGFVLWLNEDNKAGMGLSLLDGIHELPFFQYFIPGSEKYDLYKKVNQAHEYDKNSGESTFHNFDLVDGEYVVGDLSYTVARNNSANLLLKEDFSKDLNFLSNGEAGEGDFDLVGNPYMAGLDFDALSGANENVIKPCYQIWTGKGYESYSPYGASGFVGENTLGNCIAPLQAFLVEKPESPESNSLHFTEAMTTVNNPVSLRSSDNGENKLNIVAGNSVAKTLAFIANREGGQDEFGNLDARKIMNGISDVPDIYTLKPYKGGAVAVGANIIGNDEQLIPVGLATSYTGAITLSFSGMDTYNANLSLIDAEANKEVDLTGLPFYDYTVDYAPKQANGEATACEDRFFIRISKSVTGLQETLTDKVNAFETDGIIRVVSGASNPIRDVSVYNLQGDLIYRATALNTISHTIDKRWLTGVYIVKVISEKNTGNFKLIIH